MDTRTATITISGTITTTIRIHDDSPPTPLTIAPMLAWYRASDIPNAVDGASPSSWPDSSGNGHALSGFMPAYRANVINGQGAMDCDSSYISAAPFASGIGTGDFTVWGFVTIGPDAVDFYRCFTANSTDIPAFYVDHNAPDVFWDGGNGDNAFATPLQRETWYLICFVRESGVLSCYINGIRDPKHPVEASSLDMLEIVVANDTAGGAGGDWEGYIAEVGWHAKALTEAERTALESYIAQRYALPLGV